VALIGLTLGRSGEQPAKMLPEGSAPSAPDFAMLECISAHRVPMVPILWQTKLPCEGLGQEWKSGADGVGLFEAKTGRGLR
jgi:hypothetical protein